MGKKEIKGMIGLEVHVYIRTREKLFCRCAAHRERGVVPNTLVCATCTGQPGAKPMLPNKEAVKQAIRIGLMLGCRINKELIWKRKHYDWPDMPKGYQNTISGSYAVPVGVSGKFNGTEIWSMHLEEDPAAWDPETGCIDYNRSGLPLVEIVTAPDFSNSEQVLGWLKRLIHNLAYLKAVDSDAGIKVDVNVSIMGKTERVEIKNLNSIENIGRAIEYELARQAREGSERETRRFDSVSGKTVRMRGKEVEEDYRFISDPDLQEIKFNDSFVEELRKNLPESPEKKLEKIIKKYKIGEKDAEVLTKNIDIAEFFEEVAAKIDAKFALPWVTVELLRHLNYNRTNLDKVDIKVEHFVELLRLIRKGRISELQGKQLLNKFYPKSFMPSGIEEKISDKKELVEVALDVIVENKDVVEKVKGGDDKAFNFLMGEIMKKTNRRADFKIVREVLKELLK